MGRSPKRDCIPKCPTATTTLLRAEKRLLPATHHAETAGTTAPVEGALSKPSAGTEPGTRHLPAWRKELVGQSCQGTTPERHLGQPSSKHSTRGQGQDRGSSVYWAQGLGWHLPGDGGGGQPPGRGLQSKAVRTSGPGALEPKDEAVSRERAHGGGRASCPSVTTKAGEAR